nr:ABC transporter permease [Lachnospiraceae bacterium]
TLGAEIVNSLIRGVSGYAIAVLIGISLGLLINHFKYLQKNLKPIVLGVQTLPSVCWVPFSILWFGLSTQAILFVVVMGAAFSIAISVDNAIKNIQPIYVRAALTMGASKKQLYTRVVFPAALPELVSGLKQGWSFAWRALMAGEVMTTSIGLGQTLITGRDLADINQVMLVMLVIVIIGILIDKCIFSVIEKHLLKKRGLWTE